MPPELRLWILPVLLTFLPSFVAALATAMFALNIDLMAPIWSGLSLVAALMAGAFAVSYHRRRSVEWPA